MKREQQRNVNELMSFFNKVQGKEEGVNLPMPSTERWQKIAEGLSAPQKDTFESRQSLNLFLGGQGSGKTHIAGVVSAQFVSLFPKVIGLIAANTYGQLSKSTLKRIYEVWEKEFGWREYSEATNTGHFVFNKMPPVHWERLHTLPRYENILTFINGATLYIGSLDNYKALDGMEIGYALLDETKDTKEIAVKEVILGRLRMKGIYIDQKGNLTDQEVRSAKRGRTSGINTPFTPLYMFTSPAKVEWLNELFELGKYETEIYRLIFSDKTYFKANVGNKFVSISSTYLNAKNLPSNYIANQKASMSSSLQDMLIFGCPFARSGGEFYKGFDRLRNTAEGLEYNPDLPLHITFDFNVQPHPTLLVWQFSTVEGTTELRQLKEYCPVSPRNKTAYACQDFKRDFRHHRAGLFVYGDPAGMHEDTRTERGYNDFVQIDQLLKELRPHRRVEKKAPAVVKRGEFIDMLFEGKIEGYRVLIDKRCTITTADYSNLKEAADGTKLKELVEHPDTKVRYQKWGHASDANDYFICSALKQEYNAFLRGGAQRAAHRGRGKFKRD